MMTSRPRRGLREISDLFLSDSPESPPGVPTSPTPEIVLSTPSSAEGGSLMFALSFSRWLLAAFERVDLVAEPPSPAEWAGVSREFAARDAFGAAGLELGAPLPLQDNLTLLLAEDPFQAAPSRTTGERGEDRSGSDWAHVPHQDAGPGRIVVRAVQADASPELLPWVDRAALWVALLPADVNAFIRYYQLIKSATSPRRPGRKFFAVLDRSGSDNDLKKVRLAWDSVTERFLGWNVPILGQVDLKSLAGEDGPRERRARVCEETLGPPWPSDLRALCQAASGVRVLDPAAGRDESDREALYPGEALRETGTRRSG